jgi:hypothetical protein
MAYINVVSERPGHRLETGDISELSFDVRESYGLSCIQVPELARELLNYDPTTTGEFHTHPVLNKTRDGAVHWIEEQEVKETAA